MDAIGSEGLIDVWIDVVCFGWHFITHAADAGCNDASD